MSKVTDIRYVGYGVPDFNAERVFYRDIWGLKEVADQDGIAYFAAEGDPERFVVRLRPSADKRIDVIALAAETRTDVESLYAKVRAAGCRIVFEPRTLQGLGEGYGFRFFSADGLPFEISSNVQRGSARELQRWEGIPQKISHVVMHSPDHKAAADFFVKVLGFKVSDWLGDFMCFLRCNEWHHRIAFVPGPACLNHVAYDVLSVDDLMRGMARLKKTGTETVWGPGRHTAGNNTFCYFITPNGYTVEYTSDLDRIDEATWVARTYKPGPEVIDQWGIGVGGPQTMPHAEPDKGLFNPVEV